jgi:hypothetical protein
LRDDCASSASGSCAMMDVRESCIDAPIMGIRRSRVWYVALPW